MPPVDGAAGELTPAERWLALAGVCLGVLMCTIDFSVVNVSLPIMVEQLHTDFATIQWVVLSYVLVVTALMLGAGRLGDMFGERPLYIGGMALFTVSSALCGMAPSAGWLIAFRALQGLGAVLLQALGMAIVGRVFPAQQRGSALGVVGGAVSVGLALGPALGGVIIEWWGWRSVFLINVPVGLVAMSLVAKLVPPSQVGAAGQRFDFGGALLLLVTLTVYSLGLTLGQRMGFGSALCLALLAAAVAGLAGFIWWERRAEQPMLDLSIFTNKVLSMNLAMSFLIFFSLGLNLVIPFYLIQVMGLTPGQAGLMMVVVPVFMGLVSLPAGWLSDRWGSRGISLAGLLIITAGYLAMATIQPDTTPLGFALRLLPLGVGLGMFQSPNNNAVLGEAPHDRLGVVSGLLSLSRTLGNSSGVPLAGSLYTALVLISAGLPHGANVSQAPDQAMTHGVAGTYLFAAVVALFSAWLAWRAKRRSKVSP